MKDDSLRKLFNKLNSLDINKLQIFIQRLWKERTILYDIFDSISEGIIVVSNDWIIEYSNRAAEEIFGLDQSTQQILTKFAPELIGIQQTLKQSKPDNQFMIKDLEIFYPHKRSLNITGKCILHDEKTISYILIITDATTTHMMIEKQVADERFSTITLLASGVAHELGNPLNAISLRLQLMQKQLKHINYSEERNKLEKSITICEEEINRLDSVIKNFLQAIRPQKPVMHPSNLNIIIDRVLGTLSPEIHNLHIEIIHNSPVFPMILGDEKQLEQVIFNIIKNAIEAVDPHGKILIKGQYTDLQVILEISDNGHGISAEHINKISEPYFSTKETGNGLGMMVVERILQDHNAIFTIQSIINHGTKITIIFPLKDPSLPLLHT